MTLYSKLNSENYDGDFVPELKEDKKDLWSCQNTLVLFAFLGVSIGYAMRGNLSVTIVAIVKRNETGLLSTTSGNSFCPYEDQINVTEPSVEGEFSWSESKKGYILGASLFGLVISNALGGMAAARFGGKLLLGIGITLSSILTIISPTVIRYSANLFIFNRIIMGVAEGLIVPAVTALITPWFLPEERASASGSIHSGSDFGTLVILSLSGVLVKTSYFGGWPSVFYVSGGIGLIWSIFWVNFIYDSPEEHPRLSEWERNKLKSVPCTGSKISKSVPFLKILTTPTVLGIFSMQFGCNWGFYTLFTELPNYFSQIHHLDTSTNGEISSLPYALTWIVAITFSKLMTNLSTKKKISILNVRRLSMILSGYIPAVGFTALSFVGCNKFLAVALLCFSFGITGCMYSGVSCSHMDISPIYASTIAGISVALANIGSFLSPVVNGYILENNSVMMGWQFVFLLTASIYVITTTIYLITVTDEIQPWNDETDE